MSADYEPIAAPDRTTFAENAAGGPSIDAATRDKQIQDLLSNMVNVTEVSDDAKTSAHIPGLKCMLLPHQVQGVTWMREREKGKAKGGILADDMGLGKTVQTLALIVSNRPGQDLSTIDLDVPAEAERGKSGKKPATSQSAVDMVSPPTPAELPRLEMASKTTLIIAPLAVIKQWEREVSEKTQAGLKVYLYHGPSRAKKASHFSKFDIVITTYTTVASEYGNYLSKLEGLAKGTTPITATSTSKSKPKSKSKPSSKSIGRSNARSSRADSDAESGPDNGLSDWLHLFPPADADGAAIAKRHLRSHKLLRRVPLLRVGVDLLPPSAAPPAAQDNASGAAEPDEKNCQVSLIGSPQVEAMFPSNGPNFKVWILGLEFFQSNLIYHNLDTAQTVVVPRNSPS